LKTKHPDDDEVEDVFSIKHELISTQVDYVIAAIKGLQSLWPLSNLISKMHSI